MKEVKINNHLDPVSTLYHNGKCVGRITNVTAMHNVRAQIKAINGENYAIKYKGEFYPLDKNGCFTKDVPNDFYTSIEESMEELLGF